MRHASPNHRPEPLGPPGMNPACPLDGPLLAICQGLGLALAIGIGGPIAALFASMMGSLDVGFDPEGTDYGFMTATWFLVMLLAVVLLFVIARGRELLRMPVLVILAAIGAIAFAGSLAEEGYAAWPGLVVGALVTFGTAMVSGQILDGAINRAKAAGPGAADWAATSVTPAPRPRPTRPTSSSSPSPWPA